MLVWIRVTICALAKAVLSMRVYPSQSTNFCAAALTAAIFALAVASHPSVGELVCHSIIASSSKMSAL